MAALSDYAENKVIDAILRGVALGAPTTLQFALSTAVRGDSAAPTEPAGNGYSRVAVTANLANFNSTQGAAGVASTGTDGTTENATAITWPVSTGAWGTIRSVWVMDASISGNSWISIDLASPLDVSGAGFTVSFASGQLQFQIDN